MHITITSRAIGSEHIQTINARELHAFLEVGKVFAAWISERIEQYGFAEDVDYVVTVSKTGIRSNVLQKDYHISLDMAKELAMVERNDKGREARRYFIECERQLHGNSSNNPGVEYSDAKHIVEALDAVAKALRMSDSAKAAMFNKGLSPLPAVHAALPAYTIDAPLVAGSHGESSLVTKSLSALLKEHGVGLSAIKANKALEAAGFQECLARKSRKDPNTTKQFWSVTEAGLEYGKNVTSPSNPLETQPHWYAAKFPELIELSGMDKF